MEWREQRRGRGKRKGEGASKREDELFDFAEGGAHVLCLNMNASL